MTNIYTISKTLLIILFLFVFGGVVNAQETPNTTPAMVEQQLENLTENKDGIETEDDAYLQQMQHFIKDPININVAGESDLKELKIINALQIQDLIFYRKLFGNFINIYELQAVPGWNVSLIRRVQPYLTVSNKIPVGESLSKRLRNGGHSFLVRGMQVLERSKGYKLINDSVNFYPGSPQKIFVRYKYLYKNLLQYGITGEKDAGEQFFKGKQKPGFDFYSAHFFVREMGVIKAIALGDFTVNLGQGLTQWMGLAFKKSSDVLNIKRQSEILRPYNSSGEIYFHRGAGITLQKKYTEVTAFISYRKLDANFVADTLNKEDFVSSLQTSGFHRTKSETDDKNIQGQFTLGGNITYSKKQFHVGVNTVHYNFKLPIIKASDLYNKYALNGKTGGNYSIDYSYTFKNIHFFGEAAADKKLNKAFINGVLISMDSKVDMSFLYRKISRSYQSIYADAFTENTYPTNESGLYAGISINANDRLRMDAYTDIYNFPWLKFRVNAPSGGCDYLFQLTYKPNKQTEIYSRYKFERKAINYNSQEYALDPVIQKPKQDWRTQFSYKSNSLFTLRSRVELLWYDKNGPASENGFLIYTDVLYRSKQKPLSANTRFQYFETDGYNSRMYAYENDVMYNFSIPAFYDKGFRIYFNINYDFSRKLSIWMRFAKSIYPGKKYNGSGLDEITGNKKTEIKLQGIYSF